MVELKAKLALERLKVDLAVCRALAAENDDLRLRLEREVVAHAPSRRNSSRNNDRDSSKSGGSANSRSPDRSSSSRGDEGASGAIETSALLAALFRRAGELMGEMDTARQPALAFLQRPHCVGPKPYEEVLRPNEA